MSGFVEGIDRSQSSLFPAELEDYVAEDNLVRAVDAFVEGLDLGKLGFGRFAPLERGRPCYHPATWEHEAVLETVQARLDHHPEKMTVRRSTAEHPVRHDQMLDGMDALSYEEAAQ